MSLSLVRKRDIIEAYGANEAHGAKRSRGEGDVAFGTTEIAETKSKSLNIFQSVVPLVNPPQTITFNATSLSSFPGSSDSAKIQYDTIFEAATNGSVIAVEYFIQSGINPSAVNKLGNTPLMLAAGNGHLEVVKALIKARVDLSAIGKGSYTALVCAVFRGHLEIVKALIKAGADVSALDKHGNTALMCAAHKGHAEVVKALVGAGADISARNQNGSTVLMLAAGKGHLEVVKVLIEAKADLSLTSQLGHTALMCAADKGHVEVVKVLIEAKADLSVRSELGYTALMCAADKGYLEVVKALLDAGADVSAIEKDGYTALIYAADKGYLEIIKVLVNAGADVSRINKHGYTALIYAADKGYLEIVKVLLEAKADRSGKDNEGMTVLVRLLSCWNRKKNKAFLQENPDLFSENDVAYAKWYIRWKEIAHMMEISGDLIVNQKEKYPLEGARLSGYFGNKIAKSLDLINASLPTREAAKKIAQGIRFICNLENIEEAFKLWSSNNLVILKSGFLQHVVSVIFFKDIFVLCNLGRKTKRPFEVYTFEKSDLKDSTLFREITLEVRTKTENDYEQLLKKIHAKLNFRQGSLEKQIETIKQKMQVVGNCSWASLEAIVQAAFVLLALDNQEKPLHETDVQKILDEQHEVFSTWKESHRKWRIKKHFDFRKDPNVDINWKVSENVDQKMQEIWKKNGLLEAQMAP